MDERTVEDIFERVAGFLALAMDRTVEVKTVSSERVRSRPVGGGQVHISYRLGIGDGGDRRYGYLLLPLPEAAELAGRLSIQSESSIRESRLRERPDDRTKTAMMETGGVVAGAVQSALATVAGDGRAVTFAGCQGVRADVRPALQYEEGQELLSGRATLAVGDGEPFEAVLALPPIE